MRDKYAGWEAKRKAKLARAQSDLAELRARKTGKTKPAPRGDTPRVEPPVSKPVRPPASRPNGRHRKFLWPAVILVGLLIYGVVFNRPDEKASSTSASTTSAGDSAVGQELHGIEIGAGVAALDVEATERVISDLYDNFGGGLGGEQFETSWYGYIEEVGISEWDGKATVRTSLYDDSDAVQPASSICGATIAAGASGARVTDTGGSTLDECP